MAYTIYFWTLVAAFATSLISFFKKYRWPLRLLSVFLGVTVAEEWLAVHNFNWWRHLCGVPTTIPVYNMFMGVEYMFYGFYFWGLLKSLKAKKAIIIFLVCYPLFWAMTNFLTFNICVWNSRAIVVGDAAVITACAAYFRELFTADELVDLAISPEFWITAGIFIFSCCEIPITGLFNYLGDNYSKLLNSMDILLQGLNFIMYLIICYAYLCPLLTDIRKSSSP